jgi:hypothetical protein
MVALAEDFGGAVFCDRFWCARQESNLQPRLSGL